MARRIDHVQRRYRGFEPAATLVQARIRKAGESRGFAVTRLLTRWREIVGAEIAPMARPVKVSYRKDGFGATLTLLASGAQAPLVEMQKEDIRARVNACYGYNAIARIHITQTAPEGFGEDGPGFAPPAARDRQARGHEARESARDDEARGLTRDVSDAGLRAALEALGTNVLNRDRPSKGPRHDE